MAQARDIMNPHPLTVGPEVGVAELAKQLLEHDADGACVLRDGELIGVVTEMDLIFKEKKIHVPSFLQIMDAVIPLQLPGKYEDELHKITGLTVAEIMTADPTTISPETSASEAATLMVENHYSLLPVLENDELVGVVTRPGLLRAVYTEGK